MDSLNLGTAYASLELRTSRLEHQQAKAKADFEKFGKDLTRTAEKTKRDITAAFSSIGQTLTMGITAPLVALGAASIKAATDMDSLKRGLRAVAGSSEETERQLKRLREVAKLPGLGFQEAIQGSVNLQAAGLSARQAERALLGFGNALATVGKGKADLDGVTLALTQIAAKGKVSAEEINQLQERVPQIRQIMKDAFGTADTEVLQKAKISSVQFIDAVTAALEEIPKVTGGAQNAFENFSDSAKQALAKIGDVFLPAVTRALDNISPVIEKIGDAFKGLPGSAQNAFAGLAIGGAIIGPALLGLGAIANAIKNINTLLQGSMLARLLGGGAGGVAGGIAVAGGAALYGIANLGEENRISNVTRGLVAPELQRRMNDPKYLRERKAFLETQIRNFNKNRQFYQQNYPAARFKELSEQAANYRSELIGVTRAKPGKTPSRVDAAAMAEREAARKKAAEDAKQLAEQRKEALKQFQVDMATFRNKFSGMRTEAYQQFQEKIPLLGMARASEWMKARLKEIEKEEGEEKKHLDESLKRRIEDMKRRDEKMAAAVVKSNKTVKEQEQDAIKEITDRANALAEEQRFNKNEQERRAKNIASYWLGMVTKARDMVEEQINSIKFPSLPSEAAQKPVTGIPEEDLTNPTAGQDTEANVRQHVSDLAKMNKKANAELEYEAERSRNKLKRTLGGSLGVEIAYGLTDGFAKTLEKAFGKSDIGRIFVRGIMRWVDREVDNFVDSIFNSISKSAGKGGSPGGSKAGLGNSIMEGDQGGIYPGLGKFAPLMQLAGLASLKGKKQRNSLIGSLLGFGIGSLGIPGFGQLLGSSLGGLFGGLFADGGNPPIGRMALVGERGPELIMPRSAVSVVPNHALGGNSYNMPITIHANVANDYDAARMADVVQRQIERNMRLSQPVRVRR